MTRRRAVVVGATGLVGGHLLEELASDPGVPTIVAPGRRAWTPGVEGVEVTTPVVDFARPDPAAFAGDQLFVCLGTTMKRAGSREAFRRVDHDAVLAVAGAALEAGARDCLVVSSAGADPSARGFYLRVKGETEVALATLPFRSLHLFRPSILTGDRGESRPAERMGILVGSLLSPLMVGPARRYRPIAAAVVARAMARAAADPGEGRRVWESEEIAALGR